MSIRAFVDEHYHHFNAGTVRRAAVSLVEHLEQGGRLFLTLAGAMSTAEIGRSLADMIRAGHIAACLLYTSPSPRDRTRSRMPSSA